MQPHAPVEVLGCGPRVPARWTSSWASFWATQFVFESLSLYPELASDVTSLSGSASILGVMVGPSIGRAQFEFLLLFLMAAGVVLLLASVSVIARTAKVVT